MLKVSVCMRAHGIRDFPDPTSQGIRIPVRPGMPSDLGPDNPRFRAAEKRARASCLGNSTALEPSAIT